MEDALISTKFLFDERMMCSTARFAHFFGKWHITNISRGLCSADICPIRPGLTLLREFLWAYLLTDYFTDRAVDLSARVNMPKLNRVQLASIEAPVPPLALQKEFGQRVTEVGELEAAHASSRARLDTLFQSMLYRAFAGEL